MVPLPLVMVTAAVTVVSSGPDHQIWERFLPSAVFVAASRASAGAGKIVCLSHPCPWLPRSWKRLAASPDQSSRRSCTRRPNLPSRPPQWYDHLRLQWQNCVHQQHAEGRAPVPAAVGAEGYVDGPVVVVPLHMILYLAGTTAEKMNASPQDRTWHGFACSSRLLCLRLS